MAMFLPEFLHSNSQISTYVRMQINRIVQAPLNRLEGCTYLKFLKVLSIDIMASFKLPVGS